MSLDACWPKHRLRGRRLWTWLTLSVLITTVLGGSLAAQTSRAALSLQAGQETTIVLEENATTGYAWRFDAEQSTNLALVTMSDLGHQRRAGSPAIGASGFHRWLLRADKPGRVSLTFLYQRPWESETVREHVVTVDIQ